MSARNRPAIFAAEKRLTSAAEMAEWVTTVNMQDLARSGPGAHRVFMHMSTR